MLKGLTFLAPAALAVALAMPAHAETPTRDTVVARVNGEEITLGHVIVAHAALPQQYQQLPPAVLYDAILGQLVQQLTLKQSATAEPPAYVGLSLENERRSLLAAEVINGILEGAASDADIAAAYAAKYPDGIGADEFNASHILVATEEEAQAVKAELDGGADFAETAKTKSTGPSGPNGGQLGWFGAGAMVPEFEAAVMSLEPGQVSEPVQTQFGWHLIVLNETRKSEAPKLEDVREELAAEIRQAAVQARLDELTAAATIEKPEIDGLDPAVLTNIDMVRN